MGLNRLQWKHGNILEHHHGITKGMSTANSLVMLLIFVNNVTSMVVFLNLEKAFEGQVHLSF